jgi:hypothetical protein
MFPCSLGSFVRHMKKAGRDQRKRKPTQRELAAMRARIAKRQGR